jgi:hypothetical protein
VNRVDSGSGRIVFLPCVMFPHESCEPVDSYPSLVSPDNGAGNRRGVMALEIVGSRLLAPVFGNSLFVWGALIGVILAAMSSGMPLAVGFPIGTPVRRCWLVCCCSPEPGPF